MNEIVENPRRPRSDKRRAIRRPKGAVARVRSGRPVRAKVRWLPEIHGDVIAGAARTVHGQAGATAHADADAHRESVRQRGQVAGQGRRAHGFEVMPSVCGGVAAKAQHAPKTWDADARAKWESIMPHYAGDAAPYGRSLYRPRAAE